MVCSIANRACDVFQHFLWTWHSNTMAFARLAQQFTHNPSVYLIALFSYRFAETALTVRTVACMKGSRTLRYSTTEPPPVGLADHTTVNITGASTHAATATHKACATVGLLGARARSIINQHHIVIKVGRALVRTTSGLQVLIRDIVSP